MPIYEYRCEACDHPFEALVFGAERPACPACGSERLAKRLSTFAVGRAGTAPATACGMDAACPYGAEPGGPCGAGACAALD